MKTIEESFRDWEANTFGFGYGSGEEHTLAALKDFFSAVGRGDSPHGYDYLVLEERLTPTVAWLLINTLCHKRVLEYGTSPRFGWLTQQGEALKVFVDSKTLGDLIEICCNHDQDYSHCYPDACNCGPDGYEEGRKCINPFWR